MRLLFYPIEYVTRIIFVPFRYKTFVSFIKYTKREKIYIKSTKKNISFRFKIGE